MTVSVKSDAPSTPDPAPTVSYREAVRVWIRVAALSFGGPAGQIAVMHRILVDEKRWISESRFVHALNYCMLLPGPEAQQLATYVGWLLHRAKGGLTAGLLFVLPGFLSILVLSILYAGFRDVHAVEALFFGLKPAVFAVVVEAVVRIGQRSLGSRTLIGVAALAFIAIFFFAIPFPFIVITAATLGLVANRFGLATFRSAGPEEVGAALLGDQIGESARPSFRKAAKTAVIWLTVWLLPLGLLTLALGQQHILVQEGVFFSKVATVTFGGAYAVLAYVAQQAVDVFGWLQPGEMLDGLGLAETTPGPLIQVVQFVGFLGAYRAETGLNPMLSGFLGALVTTWATFAPCFLWIFVGAPFIEHLRGNRLLSSALSAISAAVVGVILNLAVWFGLHVIFGSISTRWIGPLRLLIPDFASLDVAALALATLAFFLLFRLKLSMLATLGLSAVLGILYYYFQFV